MADVLIFPMFNRKGEARRMALEYERRRRRSILKGRTYWTDYMERLAITLRAFGVSAEQVEIHARYFAAAVYVELDALKGKKLSSVDRSA